MYQLLSDIRVVEAASFIAAPYCGLTLSQLGAEVIRIDPLGGGPDAKRWPITPEGASLYWEGLNKGKRSVTLNLSDPEGRELAIALATAPGPGGGIFVTNYPEKGFLAHANLAGRRPDMVTTRILGKADGSSAVDYTINCAVGLPYMTGPPDIDMQPVNHVLPAWDLLAGSTAAVALLAALGHRSQTGQGQELRIPLDDLAAATMGHLGQIAEVLISGHDRPKSGNSLFGAFGRDFTTLDGKQIMLVGLTAKQWKSLIAALDIGFAVQSIETQLGVSFAKDEGLRYQHRDLLDPIVQQAVGALDYEQAVARFEREAVCWGPYRTLHEAVIEDAGFATANPIFSPVAHPSGATYPTPGFAASFTGVTRQSPASAPHMGEHTEEVLASLLGLPSHALADLHDRGIIRI